MSEILVLIGLACLTAVVIVVSVWLFLSLVGLVKTRVPYVPVPNAVSDAVAELVSDTAKDSVVFYDIGSGDGRVVFSVASKIPTASVTGIEISPAPFLLSLILRTHKKLSRVTLRYVDATKVSYTDATHIFLYLFPHAVKNIYPKLKQELPRGSKIISCDFPVVGVTPDETKEIVTPYKKYTLYTYTI